MMLNARQWIALSMVTLSVGVIGYRHYAYAQNESPRNGGEEGGRPFAGMPPMLAGGGTTLAVSGDKVVVIRGNTIYRLDADTLEVKAKAELPQVPNGDGNRRAATAPPSPASAGADSALLAAGRTVFGSNRCMNCHSIAGQGGGRAPDLTHIGGDARHTAEWIASYVKNPQSIDAGSDMPAFGDRISAQDYQSLGAYLASFK